VPPSGRRSTKPEPVRPDIQSLGGETVAAASYGDGEEFLVKTVVIGADAVSQT